MTRGIFFRHVLRDIALATAAVAAVLLIVLFAYQLAFVLGRAADGQIPGDAVPQLVALSLRRYLTLVLPFAVLLGTTLGLGRVYHDSEMAAAQACGIGPRTFYSSAGVVIAAAAALAAWIGFVDGPDAAARVVSLRSEALRTAVTRGLAPGQFRALGFGATLHFRAIDTDGTLRDVFIQRDVPDVDGAPRGRLQIVRAAHARYALSADGSAYLIDLTDGATHEGVPGTGNWRITQFRQQLVRVPTPDATLPGKPRVDVLPTAQLVGSGDPRLQAELHWRFGWVLVVIVAGLIAVPLARLRPRQGRHVRVLWAVLFFAVYGGLLTAGRTVLERGDSPVALGLWWVHAVALALGWALIRQPRFSDWLARRRAATPAQRLSGAGAHPASQ